MNSPMTTSSNQMDLEKQMILRAMELRSAKGVRLIRVRIVKCLRSYASAERSSTSEYLIYQRHETLAPDVVMPPAGYANISTPSIRIELHNPKWLQQ